MSLIDNFKFILPETILLLFALGILIYSLFTKNRNFLGALALTAIILASLCLPQARASHAGLFFNMLTDDAFSLFFKVVSLFVAGLIVLVSIGYKALPGEHAGEYYFLLLVATIAMLLAVSSNNLLMIYIALEMLSLVSYILVGFFKKNNLSSEGALKYFLFGALSTGVMLYGISLIYGLFGTTDLAIISQALIAGQTNILVASVLLLLILAGLCFKCGLVPFHMWVPDAYQGAPTAVTAFISVGPKAVGFAVLLRIFTKNFFPLYANWADIAMLISVFTMTIGNVIAIAQTDIKRMLGYSSIAQAGYILIGAVVGTAFGMQGVLYYILAYVLMNLGAFGCVVLVSNSVGSDAIEDYAGLYKKDPATAFMLSVFLLSLAGIPPLAGFFAKFLIFAAAIESRFIFLAIAGAVNSVIAVFYYVKVIKYMYLHEPKIKDMEKRSAPLQIALAIALVGVLVIGLFPDFFLNWIGSSQSFFSP